MPRHLLFVLAVIVPVDLAAQQPADSAARAAAAQPQDTSSACLGCPRRRPVFAFAEVMLINVVVNRFDAWVAGQDWAKVGPDDWSRNLRLGWEWDEDEFQNNMFSHPYHGALYFNAGRSNGLGYWESAPLAFLGSFTWEYFAETYRPSLNDFFMTSFGGITLGETFHRLGSSIRDNSRRGATRTWREIAALPFDPVGGINRLFSGGWSEVGPNPPEHDPEAFVFRVGAGPRVTADTGAADTAQASFTMVADLAYGDRFLRPYRVPYDVFSARAQVSSKGGLNLLRASGRLYGREIRPEWQRHRHLFEINQRYDYLSNPAIKFGAQSVELGIASRWRLSRAWTVRTDLFGDGILLGALDAPLYRLGRAHLRLRSRRGRAVRHRLRETRDDADHAAEPHRVRPHGERRRGGSHRGVQRLRADHSPVPWCGAGAVGRQLPPEQPLRRPSRRAARLSRDPAAAGVDHVHPAAERADPVKNRASYVVRRLLACAVVLAIPGTAVAQAPKPKNPHRSGLWGEFGAGPARIRVGCGGCTDVTTAAGSAGYVRIGWTISRKVLMGVESYGFTDDTFGFTEGDTSVVAESETLAAVVLWYPWRRHFYIKGGVGAAEGRFTVQPATGPPVIAGGHGVGLTFGLGYDVHVWRSLALTANAAAFITAIGDIVLPTQRIEDVIPTTYLISLGLTFR